MDKISTFRRLFVSDLESGNDQNLSSVRLLEATSFLEDCGILPKSPSSNTGIITRGCSSFSCNLKNFHHDGFYLSIDWLSFSFLPCDENGEIFDESSFNSDSFVSEFAAQSFSFLKNCLSDSFSLTFVDRDKGWMGYKYAVDLVVLSPIGESQNIGFVAFFGQSQNNRFFVSLNASGCSIVDLSSIEYWLKNLKESRITRVDLAMDDFTCPFFNVDKAVEIYKEGGFKPVRGASPGVSTAGDWITGKDLKGRTLYIGSRSSGKFTRIYEKGKQLGDPDSKWTRWETELHAHQKEPIPFDIVISPAKYFIALYPCYQDYFAHCLTVDQAVKIKTLSKKSKLVLQELLFWASRSYGKLVYFLKDKGVSDCDIVSLLSVDGLPSRLDESFITSFDRLSTLPLVEA